MRNIRYIGNSAINKAFYLQTGIIWTPGKVDTVLDDKIAAEMLMYTDVFEDAGDSFAVNSGAMSLDPAAGIQIGGAAPNAEQRAAVRAGIGIDALDRVIPNAATGQTSTDGRAVSFRENGAAVTYSYGFLSAAAGSGSRAWYAEVDMEEPVTNIGAEFKFIAGTTGRNGSVVLIPWQSSVTAAEETPPTALHLVMTRWGWNAAKILTTDGSVTTYASGAFKQVLEAGASYSAEIFIDAVNSRAYLYLPDGTTAEISDPSLSEINGSHAGWEFYQFDGDVDDRVQIGRMWAGSGKKVPLAPRAVPRHPSGISLTAVTDSNIPTSEADLDVLAVCPLYPDPLNPLVSYTIKVWVNLAAGRSYILIPTFVDIDGAVITNPAHFAHTAGADGFSGYVVFTDVQSVSSEKPVTCKLRHWSTGAGDTLAVAANKTLSMAFMPL